MSSYIAYMDPMGIYIYNMYYGKIKSWNKPPISIYIYNHIYIYAKYVCGCKYTLNVSVWGNF